MLSFVVGTDLSETDRHLMDANSRYEMIGERLSERQSELELTERAVSQYSNELQSLSSWLDDTEQIIMPLKSLSANEQEAAEKLKEHQV